MKHYVTFGQTHVHSVNGKTFDKDCVAVYEAEDRADGRAKAFGYFGNKFMTDYHGDDWNEKTMLHYFPRGYIDVTQATIKEKTYTIKEVKEMLHGIINDALCKPDRIKERSSNACALFTNKWIEENLK